ncbi:chemotaxis protein [Rhizobium sp. FKY42]|uniref:chemotaxis protein n=1 Tax=Rhizobium sp. FKY42 TaxID=2562310 RepID=UPI0010C08DF5|nr:chemotaxis protein [Rhizobium sp. FKY42]
MAMAATRQEMIVPQVTSSYADRLEEARTRIEQRFLDGGAVLLSILDILNKMVTSLDALTGSLDEGTANATMGELEATVAALSSLTEAEAKRQSGFRDIAEAERVLRPQISRMQETLRYLRTFAVTAKITGAGVPDFAGFAEEILERIQDGSQQVNGLSQKLAELGSGLGPVISKGSATLDRYSQTIPSIVSGLGRGVDQINAHRQELNQRAEQVKIIARGIQNKLASTLSAMQVGDITRQRVEHCQSSFSILEDYLASAEASSLTREAQEALRALIRQLVAAQLQQTRQDFERDTAKIVETIASFRHELGQITEIQREMIGESDKPSNRSLRDLETGIGQARSAVTEIEAVAEEAGLMTRRTLSTVEMLLKDIGIVRVVRGDIHYMALNTNLRCGKIGEEGKAINVVTAELRIFAGHLDEAAEQILEQLKVLEGAAKGLLSDAPETASAESLDERLRRALERIGAVGQAMDSDLANLAREGASGVAEMNAALQRLDFRADLGEILHRCQEELHTAALQPIDRTGLEAAIETVGPRINRIYTMASERELHATILGTAVPEEAPLTVLSDDDLDAALF